MSRTRNNVITRYTSGSMGDAVFTSDGNMRSKPDISQRVWSTSQKSHLTRFQEAKNFARMAISDPELNAYYARLAASKHGLGAWHMAIRDYYYPPSILSADFRNFTGKSGNSISICPDDEFKVMEVGISFLSPQGTMLEEGHQIINDLIEYWHYNLKTDLELVSGLTITIYVTDGPGNITQESLTWPFDCRTEILFTPKVTKRSGKKHQKSQLIFHREPL